MGDKFLVSLLFFILSPAAKLTYAVNSRSVYDVNGRKGILPPTGSETSSSPCLNYEAIMSAVYPSQMADQISCGVNGTVPDSFDWSSNTTNTVYISHIGLQESEEAGIGDVF